MSEFYDCDRCNGAGRVCQRKNDCRIQYVKKKQHLCETCGYYHICAKCLGKGKLDWIENITGVNEETIISYIQREKGN